MIVVVEMELSSCSLILNNVPISVFNLLDGGIEQEDVERVRVVRFGEKSEVDVR